MAGGEDEEDVDGGVGDADEGEVKSAVPPSNSSRDSGGGGGGGGLIYVSMAARRT
ncbi:unnamed protein product [Ectocarpus sp. CCAP 1310/34]|nr:unnamed protein product [Ectocarpus sp. CCAP 1310/34]